MNVEGWSSFRSTFLVKSVPKVGLNGQMFAKVRRYEQKRAVKEWRFNLLLVAGEGLGEIEMGHFG